MGWSVLPLQSHHISHKVSCYPQLPGHHRWVYPETRPHIPCTTSSSTTTYQFQSLITTCGTLLLAISWSSGMFCACDTACYGRLRWQPNTAWLIARKLVCALMAVAPSALLHHLHLALAIPWVTFWAHALTRRCIAATSTDTTNPCPSYMPRSHKAPKAVVL